MTDPPTTAHLAAAYAPMAAQPPVRRPAPPRLTETTARVDLARSFGTARDHDPGVTANPHRGMHTTIPLERPAGAPAALEISEHKGDVLIELLEWPEPP